MKRNTAEHGIQIIRPGLSIRLSALVRALLVALIVVYQRHISPRKGFCCAHRVLHGGDSCSQHVKRLIQQHTLVAAVPLIRLRFEDCRTACTTLQTSGLDAAQGCIAGQIGNFQFCVGCF